MIIKSLTIEFERATGEGELTPETKQIKFIDKQWLSTHPLWHKDIKIMGMLRQMILDYNSGSRE